MLIPCCMELTNYTKWCKSRLLVATANIAEATACSVTPRLLHGPGSNFCHPPAHGVEIQTLNTENILNFMDENALEKNKNTAPSGDIFLFQIIT